MIRVVRDCSCAERERVSAMCTFGLALSELVTDGCALLVTNEVTKQYALGGSICEITVDLARRSRARQDRFAYTEKMR
jgi:hypothetical protein